MLRIRLGLHVALDMCKYKHLCKGQLVIQLEADQRPRHFLRVQAHNGRYPLGDQASLSWVAAGAVRLDG